LLFSLRIVGFLQFLLIYLAGPYLGGSLGGPGPQASHQQEVSYQTPQFLRAKAVCFARLCLGVRPSVCLSVRPSVTLVSCIKTVQARITKSSHEIFTWTAPRSLVYCDKISCHWVQGFPSNEGVEEGYPLKKTSFCRYWLE